MNRIVALLVVVACGCSFVAVRSTPRDGECAGYAPVIVDTAVTVTALVLAIRSGLEHGDCGPDGCHTYDPTGLYVIPILGFGASTVWGAITASACKQAATTASR